MNRIRFFIYGLLLLKTVSGVCQTAPNVYNAAELSPNAAAANKAGGMPVNIFTGIPSVSAPLYSYSDQNGLGLHISADYFAGGIRAAEAPSVLGMGWSLNYGGEITRIVRGAPDDVSPNGFMWSSAIPNDFRSDANKYYYDTLDAEQDIFQFSINGRSGKFYITKSQQVIQVPASKLKITFATESSGSKRILTFKITTEGGVKYIFSDYETTTISSAADSIFRAAYAGTSYFSTWHISQIIAPFNTDTIRFNYTTKTVASSFGFPQSVFVKNTDHSTTTLTQATGTNSTTTKKIISINFPDKTNVNFIYGNTSLYYGDSVLSRIKIADSVFKRGYIFDYISSGYCYNCGQDVTTYAVRALLHSITPFTAKQVDKGYMFSYYPDYVADFNDPRVNQDSILTAVDDWGFMNKFNNHGNLIPTVTGLYTGANRSPSSGMFADALKQMSLPSGGWVTYVYQSNDRLPYTKDTNTVAIISYTGVTQNTISLNQLFSTHHQLSIAIDKSVSRAGSPPLSGTVNFVMTLKSTNGSITYTADTIPFADLFYSGIKTWSFKQANGSYRLDVQISGGGSVTGSLPVNISWENKLLDSSHNADTVGGLRIFKVIRQNVFDDIDGYGAITEEYHYVREDGKSSGFLGDIPKYDYPYRRMEVVSGINITTDYTGINSEPLSTVNYAQGSPVGYSRVEVIKGTSTKNLGKTVYEFTDLTDADAMYSSAAFPYAQQNIKEWAIGLPKKVSVYDSSSTLLKRAVSKYSFNETNYSGTDVKSVKLGRTLTTYTGYANATPPSPKTETYIGQEYYPATGWARLDSTTDTVFHADGTLQTSTASYTYDTNYNVIKVTSPYDRNRGLQLETRIYYPYNYTVSGTIGKLRDSSILNATIATEKWIVGDGNPRIISGNITDYQQLSGGYIKPLASYTLETNKPIIQSTITVFNAAQLNRNTTYFKQEASYPVYDNEGNILQTTNTASGLSNCQITDYHNSYVVAKISNASFSDVAYTSFESDGTGNWTIPSSLRDQTSATTGKQSYNLSNGSISKSGLSSGITYIISGWAKSGATIYANGTNITSLIVSSHNGWNFYSSSITGITTMTISGSGLIDELRLYPKDANMITYTYDPIVGVTSTCDANNTIIYNEYDGLNRLKLVRDNDKNILKRYDYEDTAVMIDVTPGWQYQHNFCEASGNRYDSLFIDTNFYSDSYGNPKLVFIAVNACTCGSPGPDYKLINGVCEEGQRYNTATTHFKRYYMDDSYDWIFRCYYHYVWSDSSYSSPDLYTERIGPHDGSGSGCTLGIDLE
jgi:hypothetical protein